MKGFMMTVKQRISNVCNIFFYTIRAQHCRGIKTVFLKGEER